MTDQTQPTATRVRPIGANTWVWESPITDDRLAGLVPRLKEWGFDLVELPVENLGDWDPARTSELLAEHDMGVSICIAMAPGRELCAADTAMIRSTQSFLRGCIGAAPRVCESFVSDAQRSSGSPR